MTRAPCALCAVGADAAAVCEAGAAHIADLASCSLDEACMVVDVAASLAPSAAPAAAPPQSPPAAVMQAVRMPGGMRRAEWAVRRSSDYDDAETASV